MSERTLWYSRDLSVVDEPLALALIKYRQAANRVVVSALPKETRPLRELSVGNVNLISSKTDDGRHLPIIDLDFPHSYVPSTHDSHGHLYLDVPISRFRWTVLMCALYFAKQIELGYFVWSIRRGGNFVRLPGHEKAPGAESGSYSYGWFRKLKK